MFIDIDFVCLDVDILMRERMFYPRGTIPFSITGEG
nr:MAG: hypothetical protein [Bacteriophage sp.]